MDGHASLIRTLIGPLWAAWERSPYLKHYRNLRRAQFDHPDAIRERQLRGVQSLVRHAYGKTTFYRDRLDRAGLRPGDIHCLDDLTRIPILTKADLRAYGAEMIAEGHHYGGLTRKATSGSTGVSVEVWVNEEARQFKRACTLLADEWSGWRFGEPVAMIWGNPDYLKRGWRGRLRNTVLERGYYLDTLRMDEATMARFAANLMRQPPSLIFGHAHSVYLFAEFVRSKGLGPIRPKGIITSAMVLHDWQRKGIEAAFDCRVTNRYGCEEVGLIACECEGHDGLHVNADGVYVEILRDGRPAAPGEAGSVVVTDLTNRAMPILRYQVGDVAVSADRRCPCGRGLPLLERLQGRESDYVVTADGDLISGISLTENFAMLVPGIAQLQIIQETVDRFVFRIVRGPDFGLPSLERIAALVAERFGTGTAYECEYVERIPQEPSGKYRFCISKVMNPFNQPAEAISQ